MIKHQPVLKIIREISTFKRMLDVIYSMRLPQVKYQIERSTFGQILKIHAQNQKGICLYVFEKELSNKDKEHIGVLESMNQNMLKLEFI